MPQRHPVRGRRPPDLHWRDRTIPIQRRRTAGLPCRPIPGCRRASGTGELTPRQVARQCSEHIQRMLGYSIHAPFMGMVNGMHPKRMLEEPQER
ncbi:hypothetical protein EMIT0324P_21105 [Pseudomonas chlororaphis]